MKVNLTCLKILISMFLLSLPCSGILYAQTPVGQKLPLNMKLSVVGGKTKKTLSDVLKDHDLNIVQFWASWCVGCGEIMAQLAQRTKTDTSIGYASISIDEDMPTALRYFKAKPDEVKAALPNSLLDKGGEKVATPLGIKSLPALLITGKDGIVKEHVVGHPKPEELTKLIAKIRDSKPTKGL